MKKLILPLSLLLFYLLAFPAQALLNARDGLLLWYRSVLPVLFPFMLLSGLFIRFRLPERILPVLSRPFHFLFGCSSYGAFAILTGFFCGFPMGAKITCDLQRQGKISSEEAYFLYGFVNNLSPSFILSFIAADQMRQPSLGVLFLCSILGSAVLYGLLSAKKMPRIPLQETNDQEPPAACGIQDIFAQIDDCIYDTIRNTVRLGAYIVMFSLLLGAVSLLLPMNHPASLLFASCIEVSSGIHMIAQAPLPFDIRCLLISVLGAFGGLSALAQSASIASMDRTLFVHYIKSRVKITLLSAIIALVPILFRLCLL